MRPSSTMTPSAACAVESRWAMAIEVGPGVAIERALRGDAAVVAERNGWSSVE